MNVRKRITIPEDELKLALEYAPLDHRTFSELVVEALKQIRRRYPKGDRNNENDRIDRLEQKVGLLYRLVRSGGYTDKISE